MANLDLTKYGITGSTVIFHNPSYEDLLKKKQRLSLQVMTKVRTLNSMR